MPLSTAKENLRRSIKAALDTVVSAGQEAEGDVSEQIIQTLSIDLANAIHDYVTSANVDVSTVVTTVSPGIPVATVGSPAAQTGASIGPGVATHTGFGSLK